MVNGKHPGGRPIKLTPEVQEKIVNCILAGNYQHIAAGAARVGVRTFRTWMAQGKRQSKSIYGEFRHAVLEAEADAESIVVEKAVAAGATDPANYWKWLERKHSQRWGKVKDELYELKQQLKELAKRVDGQSD